MGIKGFIQDSGAVRVGLLAGRLLPLNAGRKLAGWAGGYIARGDDQPMVRAVMANQWVASGGALEGEALRKRADEVIRWVAVSLFEYFYYYQHPDQGQDRVRLAPQMEETVHEIVEEKRGTIILGPHLGNFDLFGMLFARLGTKPCVLSYPNPNNAYKAQNELRESSGMTVRPIDFRTYREAKQLLRSGGCLVTGLDRPVEGEEQTKYRPKFFGRPADLPVFYVRLALETGASVRVCAGIPQADQTIRLESSEAIRFEHFDDPSMEYVLNAEKALREAEKLIRLCPEQWAMLYPVWPEVLPLITSKPRNHEEVS